MRYDLIDKFTGFVYEKDIATKSLAIEKAKEIMRINGKQPTYWSNELVIEKLLDKDELELCKGIGYTEKEIASIRYSNKLHKLMDDALKDVCKMFKI